MAFCTPTTRPSAQPRFPEPATLLGSDKSWTQGGFTVSTQKQAISKAGPIQKMEARLGIPVPEMIFGDNQVSVLHAASGWRLSFNAEAALNTVDKTGEEGLLQVSYARAWAASRGGNEEVRRVVKPFDWSYTACYRGTEVPASRGTWEGRRLVDAPEGKEIPLELLKRRDPILFFDEVVLYESELDDNGISLFNIKVRVHEKRMLLLARMWMRLDGVVVKLKDTRLYIDFETSEVIREWCIKEDTMEKVKHVSSFVKVDHIELTENPRKGHLNLELQILRKWSTF